MTINPSQPSGDYSPVDKSWSTVVKDVRIQELRDAVTNLRFAERRLWIAVTTARKTGMHWRAIASEVGVAASWLLTQSRRPGERITLPRTIHRVADQEVQP